MGGILEGTPLNPLSFSRIQGQERAHDFLRAAAQGGRLAHALLFTGPRGVGKFSTARSFAAALNCQNAEAGDWFGAAGETPCGVCPVCQRVSAGTHPDLTILRTPPEKSEIPVEAVREMIAALAYPPFEGRVRVVLIDGAEELNRHSANSLLKTLEEPPPRVVLILIAHEMSRLPATIVSRCQLVRFNPLPDELVQRQLARRGELPPVQLAFAAAYAAGSMAADAAELEQALALRDVFLQAWQSALGEREAKLSQLAEAAAQAGTERPLLRVLRLWLREQWLTEAGAGEGSHLPGRKKPANAERVFALAERLAEVEGEMRYGRANAKLALESLFVDLARLGG